MPLEEAMRTQRQIRRLEPDPVDDELVLKLIELALEAPTGGNQQNWEFVLVKDRAVKERLGRYNRQAWRIYGGLGRIAMRDRPDMLRILKAGAGRAKPSATPRLVTGPSRRGAGPLPPPVAATSYYGSIYPSVQNL